MPRAGYSRVTHPFAAVPWTEVQVLARLACVKRAASVRPEPGSNSPSRSRHERRPEGATTCHDLFESRRTGHYPFDNSHDKRANAPPCVNQRRPSSANRGRTPALAFGYHSSVFKERLPESTRPRPMKAQLFSGGHPPVRHRGQPGSARASVSIRYTQLARRTASPRRRTPHPRKGRQGSQTASSAWAFPTRPGHLPRSGPSL